VAFEESLTPIDNMIGSLITAKSYPPENFYDHKYLEKEVEEAFRKGDLEKYAFFLATSIISTARKIEIFKYQYCQILFDQLTDVKSNVQVLNLTSAAFYLRSFLEVTSQFLGRSENMIEITQKLAELKSNSPLFPDISESSLNLIRELNVQMDQDSLFMSINLAALANDDWDSIEKIPDFLNPVEGFKSKNIISYLKKIEKTIPQINPLYSACSEIIHPNSWIHLSSIDTGLLENQQSVSGYLTFSPGSERMKTEMHFEYYWSIIERLLISVFDKLRSSLAKTLLQLDESYKDSLAICIPISRHILSHYTYGDQDYLPAKCPCGSGNNTFNCQCLLF